MTELETLTKKLKYRLSLPLPGLDAQLRMAHVERRRNMSRYKIPDDARIGAVLILLFEDGNKIKTVLIERQQYDGVHSGQIAFPGGKLEGEETLEEAALREAYEEVGVSPSDVRILGALTNLYIPPSNFLVHPFVATIDYKPNFIPHEDEVEKVIEWDLEYFLDDSKILEKELTLSNGFVVKTPVYNIGGKTIWGATAMIISELVHVMKEM